MTSPAVHWCWNALSRPCHNMLPEVYERTSVRNTVVWPCHIVVLMHLASLRTLQSIGWNKGLRKRSCSCCCCAILAINSWGCPQDMVVCVYDCLHRHMSSHTLTSDALPRRRPPPHFFQQLKNLLLCVEEIVIIKPDLGTQILPPKAEKYLSLVKTSPMRQHHTI